MSTDREDKYYANDRFDIIALIPPDARRVLDVGCGFGMMGKRIKKEKNNVEVVGVEKVESAAKIAIDNVDKLIIGDVEEVKLPFEEGYFDCLVYGDVLEHLNDPRKLLKDHAFYLKKGGYCIACLPNVSHYSIINGLMRDKWEYETSGILDESHLRFFTLNGIEKMFNDAGYSIEEIKRYIRGSKAKKILNNLSGGRINYLLTEQYIIKARLR